MWNYRAECDHPGLVDVINDDMVLLHLQYSSQWDTLAHVGALFDADGDGVAEPVFYNGYRGGTDIVGPTDPKDAGAIPAPSSRRSPHRGAKALGVENMAEKCLQGRGVMIDLFAHFGRRKQAVSYDELMRVIAADGIKVEAGDFVCLQTGFDEVILEQNKQPTRRHAQHLHRSRWHGRKAPPVDHGIETGRADLRQLRGRGPQRALKPGQCAALPLHQHCLFKTGVNLGEIWRLSELADWLRNNNRSRFLMTAPPLRLPGAVGSPANAIATV